MDEYIFEITDRLSGRVTIPPSKIMLRHNTEMYELADKITDYYLRPDRLWYDNVCRVFFRVLSQKLANVLRTILTRTPGIKFSFKLKTSDLWKFAVVLDGQKYIGSVTIPHNPAHGYGKNFMKDVKEFMLAAGCESNAGTIRYYYPRDNVKYTIVLDWAH